MVAGTGVRGNARHHPRTDELRHSRAAQPGRVGNAADVAVTPGAGAVGDRAARAVEGAGQDAALAVQLDGLRPAGMPAVWERRGIPRQPTPMTDVRPTYLAHPPPNMCPPPRHLRASLRQVALCPALAEPGTACFPTRAAGTPTKSPGSWESCWEQDVLRRDRLKLMSAHDGRHRWLRQADTTARWPGRAGHGS
jgi:hypothetical protein